MQTATQEPSSVLMAQGPVATCICPGCRYTADGVFGSTAGADVTASTPSTGVMMRVGGLAMITLAPRRPWLARAEQGEGSLFGDQSEHVVVLRPQPAPVR